VGSWIDGAAAALQRLMAAGHHVCVHSCRATWEVGGGTDAVREFLLRESFIPVLVVGMEQQLVDPMLRHVNGLRPDRCEVGIWVGVGKPVAHWYVDDRGVSFDAERGWPFMLDVLLALAG
jgi:hypothetical protein